MRANETQDYIDQRFPFQLPPSHEGELLPSNGGYVSAWISTPALA